MKKFELNEYYEGIYEVIKIEQIDPPMARIVSLKKLTKLTDSHTLNKLVPISGYLVLGLKHGHWIKLPKLKGVLKYG